MSSMHLSLYTNNIEESCQFYQDLFNRTPLKKTESFVKFRLSQPSLTLSLTYTNQPIKDSSLNHLGIILESSTKVFEEQKRLEKLGYTTNIEEKVDCCYAIQDKVWVKDPQGNAWEIYAVLDQTSGASDASSKCCA